MANHPDLQLKTWVLRVYIHCEGCRKKVYKILQNIDGVYKTVIDPQQHKAIVIGSVTGDTLVQKLLKSGKHAEILPENPEPKKKQSNKKKSDHAEPTVFPKEEEEEEEEEAEPEDDEGEIEQKIIVPIVTGSGEDENNAPPSGKNNNKKKKNKKKNKKVSPNNETESQATANNDNLPPEYDESPTIMNGDESDKEQSHFVAPSDQLVYATPHNFQPPPPLPPQPPYFGYYPTPAYGMSYNTSYPSSEASYYTPPVYGYAQSHPSAAYNYNPAPLPPPAYYHRRSAFDVDQEDEGKGYCTIM